jgi:quercetin 2,3-dioxygenase
VSISGIAAEPTYFDVSLSAAGSFVQPIPRGHSAFAYLFEGEVCFGPEDLCAIIE